MAQAHPQYKNILIIHFGQLGDVVLGLPALRAIREYFADAKITVMSGTSTAEIIRLADMADEQIAVDRVKLRDGNRLASIAEMGRLVKDVRGRGFDLVIDLNSLYETNLLGILSGAKHRLFANRHRRSFDRFSNFPVKPPAEDRTKHHTDRYLAVLEALGLNNIHRTVTVSPPSGSVEKANAFLKAHRIANKMIIGLFLGAGHPTRRWSVDNFVEVARRLSKDPGKRVLVFLGPEESDMRDGLDEIFGDAAIVVEEMPLSDFLAMLSVLKVLVVGDTGPMHLGAIAGTGIVLLSVIGSPTIFRPLVENLRVLDDRPIAEITVDQVEFAVNELAG